MKEALEQARGLLATAPPRPDENSEGSRYWRSGRITLLVAEGRLVVGQLLRSPYRPRSFLVTDRLLPVLTELLADAPAGSSPAPVYVAGAKSITLPIGP